MECANFYLGRVEHVVSRVIYLITTNRADWAPFAYEQWKKWSNSRLVILDNSKESIDFWKDIECEHHHIPQCNNIGEMFNWFVAQYKGDEHLFYMDDDIELSSGIPEIEINLRYFNCVLLNNVYVSQREKKRTWKWIRNDINVGSAWLAHKDFWPTLKFRHSNEGVGAVMRDVLNYRASVAHIYKPLTNYMLHEKNVVFKEEMFEGKFEEVPEVFLT